LPPVDCCYYKKITSPPPLLASQATAAAPPLPLHCNSVFLACICRLVDCCFDFVSPMPIDSCHGFTAHWQQAICTTITLDNAFLQFFLCYWWQLIAVFNSKMHPSAFAVVTCLTAAAVVSTCTTVRH